MPDQYSDYELYSGILDNINANPDQYPDNIKTAIADRVQSYTDGLDHYSAITPEAPVTDKLYEDTRKKMEALSKTSAKDEKLYGFIPGDWMYDWMKAGYNNSIQGLAHTIMTGEEKFDLSGYDPGLLEDVGATILSFLQPVDIATMFAGGGIGGIAAKAGLKKLAMKGLKESLETAVEKGVTRKVLRKPVRSNIVNAMLADDKKKAVKIFTNHKVKKKVAEDAIEKAAPRVIHRAMAEGATGATGLGFYSGLQTHLGQEIGPGDVSFVNTLKGAATGATLGFVTAGTGPLVKSVMKPTDTALGKLAQATALRAIETAEFGTLAPALEGRMPTPEDYAHAAGVIGGLNVIRALPKAAIRKGKEKIVESIDPEKIGGVIAEHLGKEIASEQIWVNKKGEQLKGDPRFFKHKKKEMVELTDPVTGDKVTMTKKKFFDSGYQRRKTQIKPENLERSRQREIFKILGDLKKKGSITLDGFRKKINDILGPDKEIDFTKEKEGKTGYSSIMGDPVKVVKLLDSMRKEQLRVETVENLKKEWNVDAIPTKTLVNHLVPDLFKQATNRVSTALGVLSVKEINNTDARSGTLAGDLIQRATVIGLYKYGFFKKPKGTGTIKTQDGKEISISKASAKEYYEDLGRRIGSKDHQGDPDVKRYRKMLDHMWDVAEAAGIKLAGKRENYFPDVVRPEMLDIISNDFYRLMDKYPFLFESGLMKDRALASQIDKIISKEAGILDPNTLEALHHVRDQIKDATGKTAPDSMAEAFSRLKHTLFYKRHSISPNLEKEKKVNLPEHFYIRDARVVLTKYIHDWARRVSYVEQWGNKGELMEARLSALKEMARDKPVKERGAIHKEIEVITNIWESYTNAIERNPSKAVKDPRARKLIDFLVNFEVASKIGFGYATIPNITQVLISSAVKAGYWNTFKGVYNLIFKPEYREMIRKDAEFSRLSFFQMMAGIEPSNSKMGWIADRITRLNQFQRMNRLNLLMSGAAGYEYIGHLQKTSKSKIRARRNWAKGNLKDLGINNPNKISERQLSESIYKFARDSQLQRNVLHDPIAFNDPRFRPLVLFKRFGYRQAAWIKDQLIQDTIKRGNVVLPLRLMVSGFIGGQFVAYAKKALNDILAGENEILDENQLIFPFLPEGTFTDDNDIYTDLSKMTWSDALDMLGNVGALGLISDILAAENTLRALEFAVKPAIYQDMMKAVDAMVRVHEDMKDYGMGFLPRMPKYIAPILGTAPKRLAVRIEKEYAKGQRQSYLEFRKGKIKSRIMDHIINGNSEMASRLIRKWNTSYPQEAIMYDDVGIDAIRKKLQRDYEKRLNP